MIYEPLLTEVCRSLEHCILGVFNISSHAYLPVHPHLHLFFRIVPKP